MSGHNKWSQIKHKKGATDAKKSLTFGKILAAISVAAKTGGANPDQNPHLRSLIEKAKENNVPNENIERALKRASESRDLQEFLFEAYGPEGAAILVEAITDNPNRLIQELRIIAGDIGAKPADPGSVLWAFTKQNYETGWVAKFPQPISDAGQEKLHRIVEAFNGHDDVQRVIANVANQTI
ncbi:MAG: YebC/PmpR family DNA-binding transcriptional regulator [bacterium]|nr:YebC/PmpR family DNA-binding transcriptional regulator [bacterium]